MRIEGLSGGVGVERGVGGDAVNLDGFGGGEFRCEVGGGGWGGVADEPGVLDIAVFAENGNGESGGDAIVVADL